MENEFEIGTVVKLNTKGQDCYERNKSYKNISPDSLFIIKSFKSYDSGRSIWEVEWNSKTDLYFGDELEILK